MIKKILKFLLIGLIWSLVAAGITIAAAYLGYAWKIGLLVSAGLFIIWLGFLVGRKLIVRHRAKKRVQHLIQIEDRDQTPHDSSQPSPSSGKAEDVTRSFRRLIKLLRKSALKKQGDPIYVLPWYMLLGLDGSGKTTAMNAALLPGPLFEQGPASGHSLNYYAYNQGVILDTPGTCVSDSAGADRNSWLKLLGLLEKKHGKEPLNGLVLTVPTDRLLQAGEEELVAEGRLLRARITELMHRLNRKVPVYLLITKSDLLEGFSEWAATLHPKERLQVMGHIVTDEESGVDERITRAMDSVSERTKDLMLRALETPTAHRRVLRLSAGLEGIKHGLLHLADGLFRPTPYQEAPFLRGIYFSGLLATAGGEQHTGSGVFLRELFTRVLPPDRRVSAVLSGATLVQHFIRRSALGLWGAVAVGALLLLIGGFRSDIRYLQTVTDRYAGTFVRQAAWEDNLKAAFNLQELVCSVEDRIDTGWIPWFGFVGDPVFLRKMKDIYIERFRRNLLQPVDREFFEAVRGHRRTQSAPRGNPQTKGGYFLAVASLRNQGNAQSMAGDLMAEQYPAVVQKISLKGSGRWYRVSLGPYASKSEAGNLTGAMASRGHNDVFITRARTPGEKHEDANREDRQDSFFRPENKARHVDALVSRILVLQEVVEGAGYEEAAQRGSPFSDAGLFLSGRPDQKQMDTFSKLYLRSLFWSRDQEALHRELKRLRKELRRLLSGGNKDFSWIIPLASARIAPEDSLKLSFYWSGSGTKEPDVLLPGAYTIAVKAFIDDYIRRVLDADPYSIQLKKMRHSFYQLYKRRYLEAVQRAALNFNKGLNSLRVRQEWIDMIDSVAGKQCPHFHALAVLYEQLEPFRSDSDLPEWAQLLNYFHNVTAFTKETGPDTTAIAKIGLKLMKKLGPVGKTISKTGKKGLKTKKKLDSATPEEKRDMVLEEAAAAVDNYKKALVDIAFNAGSRPVSFKAIRAIFSNPEQPGAGEGPLAAAYRSVHELQSLIGKRTRANAAFWELYLGPLRLAREYMLKEACCELQYKWNDHLLVEIEDVPEYKLGSLLFGPEGKVWQFLTTDAAPFVAKKYGTGYVPTRARGMRMPFRPEFLEFVTRGRDHVQSGRESYPVHIKTLPTSTNPEARIVPSATHLRLQCGSDIQRLNNFNYAADRTFTWSDACGDVLLSVTMGDIMLTKTYPGPKGFPRFLKAFRDGNKRFTPDAFPEYRQQLRDMGVSYIEVQYGISGHEAVIATLKNIPLTVPRTITASWEDAL